MHISGAFKPYQKVNIEDQKVNIETQKQECGNGFADHIMYP